MIGFVPPWGGRIEDLSSRRGPRPRLRCLRLQPGVGCSGESCTANLPRMTWFLRLWQVGSPWTGSPSPWSLPSPLPGRRRPLQPSHRAATQYLQLTALLLQGGRGSLCSLAEPASLRCFAVMSAVRCTHICLLQVVCVLPVCLLACCCRAHGPSLHSICVGPVYPSAAGVASIGWGPGHGQPGLAPVSFDGLKVPGGLRPPFCSAA